MTVRSLFNIIIKVIGIFLIKDIIFSIPYLIRTIYDFGQSDVNGAFTLLLFSLVSIFIYSIMMYYAIFKTDWIIDKLKLAERVPEDPLPLNVHRSTVYSFATIFVGLYLIVQAIPLLVRQVALWWQYRDMAKGFLNSGAPFDYSIMLVYAAEIIIGLLLIGNQRAIVNFIEHRQRKAG